MSQPGDDGRLLSSAAGRLAHEIKNSLAGIQGALGVLKDRIGSSEPTDEVMSRIESELERVATSVSELSLFASSQQPVMRLRSLHDVIEASIASTALGESTRIERRYDPDVPMVHVDERLLEQALIRVLRNAVEAMPGGGTLTIATRVEPHAATISIHDTGAGVPSEDHDRIFEPFFTRKLRGLGLGLAITRTLVDSHGGKLSVASPPRGGTEFSIVLPRS